MFGNSWPVFAFTLMSCGLWLATLVWTIQQRRRRVAGHWHYIWVLLVSTLFWWSGESLAIRLGRYEYNPQLPLATQWFPGGGTPTEHGWINNVLLKRISDRVHSGAEYEDAAPLAGQARPECIQENWNVPIPVVMLEATLLFAFFRIATLRLDRRASKMAPLATAGICGLLMINSTAILDPVVSTSAWCGTPGAGSDYQGLNVGLWHWLTSDKHPGFWFGVPLVNYASWFLAAFVFSFIARLDDYTPGGIVKERKDWLRHIVPGVAFVLLVVLALMPLKTLVDVLLVHGQSFLFESSPVFKVRVWQFGVMVLIIALGGWAIAFGRARQHTHLDHVSAWPVFAVFGFCFVLLLRQIHVGMLMVWLVTAGISGAVYFWDDLKRFVAWVIARFRRQDAPVGGDVGRGVGVSG